MKKEYFVNIRPGAIVKHRLHTDGCPFNHKSGNRIALGRFSSPGEALEEAGKMFHDTISCPYCARELRSERIQKLRSGYHLSLIPSTFESISPNMESALFSALS